MTEQQLRDKELVSTYKFIENIVRNEHRRNINLFLHQAYDVQDLIQECWVKVLNILETESGRDDIKDMKRFVNRSVQNKLMDMLDHIHFVIRYEVVKTEFSESSDTSLELNDDFNSGGEDNPDHYLSLFDIEMQDIMLEIKKILTPQEYAIVVARYNGMTFKEITKHLACASWGRSEPIIMAVYKEAKNKIKEFFGNEGIDEYQNFVNSMSSTPRACSSNCRTENIDVSGIQAVKKDIELAIAQESLEVKDFIESVKHVLTATEHFVVSHKLRGYIIKEIALMPELRNLSKSRVNQIYWQAKNKILEFIEQEGLFQYTSLFKKGKK